MRVMGLAGWSGAGKTTLLARLIPHFNAQGLRVSTIKHAHHNFDVDREGKDSWIHRQSGAVEVLISSEKRWALMHELRGAPQPRLTDLLRHLAPVDLVLVEGYKSDSHRKIEIHRAANGKPVIYPDDPAIMGVASDVALDTKLPVVGLEDVPAIAEMILRFAMDAREIMSREPAKA